MEFIHGYKKVETGVGRLYDPASGLDDLHGHQDQRQDHPFYDVGSLGPVTIPVE